VPIKGNAAVKSTYIMESWRVTHDSFVLNRGKAILQKRP